MSIINSQVTEELKRPTPLAWSAPVLTTKLGMRLLQGRGKLTRSFSSKWSQIFLRMLHFDTSVKHTHKRTSNFALISFSTFLLGTSSLQTITALILKALHVVCSLLIASTMNRVLHKHCTSDQGDESCSPLSAVGSRAFFLFLVHLHGMTFPFLSDRNPLWTHSNVLCNLKTFLSPKL